jgi:hypothetical protein
VIKIMQDNSIIFPLYITGIKVKTEKKNLTYKYQRPVSWHISEDRDPVRELPRKPLHE